MRRSEQYYPIIESVFYDIKTKIIHTHTHKHAQTHIYVYMFMFKLQYRNGDISYTMIRLHNARYTHIDR